MLILNKFVAGTSSHRHHHVTTVSVVNYVQELVVRLSAVAVWNAVRNAVEKKLHPIIYRKYHFVKKLPWRKNLNMIHRFKQLVIVRSYANC